MKLQLQKKIKKVVVQKCTFVSCVEKISIPPLKKWFRTWWVKVYKAQCRKEEKIKQGMRKVHEDLVSKGFMTKLDQMDEDQRKFIMESKFWHYHIWRIVYKADSISTPVRIVVDPTMTGLNLILAKGEKNMESISGIVTWNRTFTLAWSSDISKLYNQLHLEKESLPYSLFLYSEALDPQVEPEVWVMTRAWYGVTPTGNQASLAIEKLVNMNKEKYPESQTPLLAARYVDDITPGCYTEEQRSKQINDVTSVLSLGGFALKYVTKLGEDPPPEA